MGRWFFAFLVIAFLPQCLWALDAEPPKKSLEERVAELEATHSLNLFSFSAFFITTYDNISTTQSFPSALTYNNLDYYRLRFSLNADADISKSVKFYSRFTVNKFFNQWQSQGTSSIVGEDLGSVTDYSRGSGVFLEKAYLDLITSDENLIFSIGRLPTVDGTPTNFWDMHARMGTYPLMSFDYPLDGVALTYKVDDFLPSGHQLALRILYTPFTNVYFGAEHNNAYILPPKADSNNGTPEGNDVNTMVDLGAVQLDYSYKEPAWADQANLIFQYYQSGNVPMPSGNGTSTLSVQTSAATLVAEAMSIAKTGFDMSLSYTYSNLGSHGLYDGNGTGLGTAADQENFYGNVVLASLRYHWSDDWAVGAEWLHGSNAVFHYGSDEEDLTDFYQTNGTGKHIYVTRKFASFVSLRVGYREQDETNLGFQVGPLQSTDRKIKTTYVTLRTDF